MNSEKINHLQEINSWRIRVDVTNKWLMLDHQLTHDSMNERMVGWSVGCMENRWKNFILGGRMVYDIDGCWQYGSDRNQKPKPTLR